MATIDFHKLDSVDDNKITFAVICAKHQSKWIWCKNKKKGTWEIPGGKREPGESIIQAATRELAEETCISNAELTAAFDYSITMNSTTTFGRVFYAKVDTFLPAQLLHEIEAIDTFQTIPQDLSWPLFQPFIFEKIVQWEKENIK